MIINPYRFAAPAGPFDPQTQGTLVAWYDAPTMGLTPGGVVSAMPDHKTGNPYPLTRLTGGAGVTYQLGVQNGQPALVYTNPEDFGDGPDASTYPYTLAAVVNMGGSTGTRTFLGPDTPGGLQFRIESSDVLGLVESQIAYIGSSSSPVPAGWHLIVATIDATDYAFYIDGVAAGSGSHSVPLIAGRVFRMGFSSGGEAFSTGSIGEVQIYSSVLNAGDLAGLHTYSVNKWATP